MVGQPGTLPAVALSHSGINTTKLMSRVTYRIRTCNFQMMAFLSFPAVANLSPLWDHATPHTSSLCSWRTLMALMISNDEVDKPPDWVDVLVMVGALLGRLAFVYMI